MWSNFIYIDIDKSQNKVITSGIDFHDFSNALKHCKNYLILAGEPSESKFSLNVLLEYVCNNQVNAFLLDDVENWGDFCWIDFEDSKSLETLSKEELAEIYYMLHKHEPLTNFKIKGLNNKFAYLCHDDGIWNAVYYEDLQLFKNILKYKLTNEMKKNKIAMLEIVINNQLIKTEINNEIIEKLFVLACSGVIIDFKYIKNKKIYCYNVKRKLCTVDEIESIIARERNELGK